VGLWDSAAAQPTAPILQPSPPFAQLVLLVLPPPLWMLWTQQPGANHNHPLHRDFHTIDGNIMMMMMIIMSIIIVVLPLPLPLPLLLLLLPLPLLLP